MQTGRTSHTATLLANGKVLVAGGQVNLPQTIGLFATNTAELFDPATGTFRSLPDMVEYHVFHSAILLPAGPALIVGGAEDCPVDGCSAVTEAELYNVRRRAFSATREPHYARMQQAVAAICRNQVLAMGGLVTQQGPVSLSASSTAEIFNGKKWSVAADMQQARFGHTATGLADGTVLVTGGDSSAIIPLATAELFLPGCKRSPKP